jgi:hypothetical protein
VSSEILRVMAGLYVSTKAALKSSGSGCG